jgi:hypothetical protein
MPPRGLTEMLSGLFSTDASGDANSTRIVSLAGSYSKT